MENQVGKINKQYPDGKIIKIGFGKNYKSCHMDFVPYIKNKQSKVLLKLTFTPCVQFLFTSLDYQFAKREQEFLDVIAWGVDSDSNYLNNFLQQIKNDPVGSPQEHPEFIKNLKHFYFQGFEANIDIIASRLEIEEVKS